MNDLPPDLLQALPPDALPAVLSWCSSLDAPRRRQVADLWDRRIEVRVFTPQADESGVPDSWDHLPRVVGGRFVPHDDAWGLNEWGPGYFETPPPAPRALPRLEAGFPQTCLRLHPPPRRPRVPRLRPRPRLLHLPPRFDRPRPRAL